MIKTGFYIVFRWMCNYFAGTGIGSNRLIAKLYHIVLPLVRPNSINIDGHTIFLDKGDCSALSIFGVYEPTVGEVIKKEVIAGMTALDIGANIGYFTLMMADCVGKDGVVYAFEPNPENFKLLEKNINKNGHKNVVTVKVAVIAKKGKIPLYVESNSPAEYSVYDFWGGGRKVMVDSCSLDEYFRRKDQKIDFVKFDIQGAEGEALLGMKRIINKNPQIKILTEVWPEGIKKSGIDVKKYLDMLESFGFKFCLLRENVKYKSKAISKKSLLLFLKKSVSANVLCFRK